MSAGLILLVRVINDIGFIPDCQYIGSLGVNAAFPVDDMCYATV